MMTDRLGTAIEREQAMPAHLSPLEVKEALKAAGRRPD